VTPTAAPEEIENRLRAVAANGSLNHADELAVAALEQFDLEFAEEGRGPVRRTRSRRFSTMGAAIALTLVAIVAANTAGVYLAPKYGRILADAPGIGAISGRYLQAVGLGPGDVTLGGDSAVSAGHTLKLVGAYSDGLRIALFLSIDGKGVTGDPKQYGRNAGDWSVNYDDVTLTDQFGHAYGMQGVGGPTDIQFQPLAWPASQAGGRLTLHVTGIWPMSNLAAKPNTVLDPETVTVHGDWTLHVTVESQPVYNIRPPAPVQSGAQRYTFTSIVASGKTLIIRWSGAADPAFPSVFDAAGNQVQMEEGGGGEETLFINGAGRYRIQFGADAPLDQQRWIVVP
jgi:hypothetical protein